MFRPIAPRVPQISREVIAGKAGAISASVFVALLLIWLPFPFDVALIGAPVAAFLLFISPVLLPIGLIASVPLQDLLPFPSGVPLTGTRAAIVAALAVVPLIVIARASPIRWSGLILVMGAYISLMVVSLLNAANPSAGYGEMYRWIVAIIAFWLVVQFVQSRRHVVLLALLFAFFAATQGAIGVLQALTGWGPESFEIGPGFSRAYGTFGMPNSYAAYMEAVTIPLIPLAAWSAGRLWRSIQEYRRERLAGFLASGQARSELVISLFLAALLASGVMLGMAGIAMSFSRGGWLGIAAAATVIIVLLGRRYVVTTGITASMAAIALLLGASSTVLTVLEDRFAQIVDQVRIGDVRGVQVTSENFATVERLAHWQTAIEMWSNHPWIGVGVGNFDTRFREFAVHPFFLESQGHAHNYYLHALAETGVLGLSVYIVLLAGALILGWNAYRSHDPLARMTGIGAIGLTVALAVHNLFENLHVLNISVQITVVWALAVVAARWTKNAEPASDSDAAQQASK